MRVLHVIPYLSPVYGGPTVVVEQMIDVFSRLDVEISVATTTADGCTELDVNVDQPIIKNGVRYYFFDRQGPKFWMFSWPLRNWLYEHVPNYDLVHVHGLFAYTSLPACSAARRNGKPFIITPHGMLDPWCLSHKFWKKWPYYFFFERQNLHFASAVHATSAFEAEGIANLGFDSKTHVIPLSVEIPVLPERYHKDVHNLSLLFMARIVPIKGLPILLQAVALLNTRGFFVTLNVVGQGSFEYLSEIKLMVSKLEISKCVRLLGFLDGVEKSQALADADVFVLPSQHENFSLATAEAMAAGLPVIVSDQVGIAREIMDADAGVVVPVSSPVALADAIETFRYSEYRNRIGANGRKLVEQKFSKKEFGESLLHLYNKAMAQASAF